ncbi:alpha/beta fold hydrolase [Endozoicomonadaceae bacterium StTr2]
MSNTLTNYSAACFSTLPLRDGRSVEYCFSGNNATADDLPVLVLHHGTPCEASIARLWWDTTLKHQAHLLAVSRPGHAMSDTLPGRDIAGAIPDILAVLDHLGIDQFVTAGWSGGGPHALALAAQAPERCKAAACITSIGPAQASDLDFFAGMTPTNHEIFTRALEGRAGLEQWILDNGPRFSNLTGEKLAAEMSAMLPPEDQQTMQGDFASAFAASFTRAMSNGMEGWIDDDMAFVNDWGFDPRQLTVPVMIWSGGLDKMMPVAHSQWLADTIPGARHCYQANEGHLSVFNNCQNEIISGLLSHLK